MTTPVPTPTPQRPVSADTVVTSVLVFVSGLVAYLCFLVVSPFLPALAGALALAVIAQPVQRRVEQRIKSPSLGAGLTVVAIVLLLLAPAVFVTHSLLNQAAKYAGIVQEGIQSGRWENQLKENRYVGPLVKRITDLTDPDATEGDQKSSDAADDDKSADGKADQEPTDGNEPDSKPAENPDPPPAAPEDRSAEQAREPGDETPAEPKQNAADLSASKTAGELPSQESQSSGWWSPFGTSSSSSIARAAGMVTSRVGSLVSGAGWVGMQLLITVMCVFFFLRDRHAVLRGVKALLPLSEAEANKILSRIDDTIHATLFGSLTVALVQGTMGGLMFWILGIPSPLFWGAIMSLLAVVPMLGTFVIWGPTAVWLASQGDWTRAGILVAWGAIAIGLIDNFLYPYLVGNRMRFHTLLVFFAIVGGLTVFGAAGIILGPVLLAVADGLFQVWRHRIERSPQDVSSGEHA